MNEYEKTINELKLINNQFPSVIIYVFGSYIWGSPRKDSDLDIAIKTDNIYEFSCISDVIEECSSTINFDILNFNTLNNEKLKERILKYGKQIWFKI